jgi:MFS transporter, BCD family, chlorophyll transporter
VIQGSAVVTIFLNIFATWKQEALRPSSTAAAAAPQPTFKESWDKFIVQHRALRRLLVIGFGTLAFTMSDIVLEPYGGQVLGLGVGATTKLTAIFAGGSLVGFTLASQILSRGGDPFRMSAFGALLGLPAFAMVIAAAPLQSAPLFSIGVLLIGCGAGLFSHGTLTATMRYAPADQVGMALGAWGAVQATAAGIGAALGGLLRDFGSDFALFASLPKIANGYLAVYLLEMLLLAATLAIMVPMLRQRLVTSAVR